ncbi:MAG: ribose-phosphate diphosphokinase [Candidatus Saccharimonadales bacterium]
MIGFAMPGFEHLLPKHVSRGTFQINRFPNNELAIELDECVNKNHALIVGSIAPADEDLLVFTLLADTLRRCGATRIIALLPYLGYARQDEAKPNESLGMAWAGRLARASGVYEIITVDLHSPQAAKACPVPIRSLSPATLFAKAVGKQDFTVVAPDEGATDRAGDIAKELGAAPPVVLPKQRMESDVQHLGLPVPADKTALVVDDVLDTGSTLVSACQHLKSQGVKDIVIAVTHGLFTGTKWQKLWKLGVSRLFVSDSLPLPVSLQKDEKVKICKLQSLLTQVFH